MLSRKDRTQVFERFYFSPRDKALGLQPIQMHIHFGRAVGLIPSTYDPRVWALQPKPTTQAEPGGDNLCNPSREFANKRGPPTDL